MACESSLLFGIYSQTKQKFQVLKHKWINCFITLALIHNSCSMVYGELGPFYCSADYDGAFLFTFTVQGEIQNNRPQLQVIIPSAAFAGALISFILCPTELVKVCGC